ncbi:UNVERIFIED_CONTAM: FAD synthetase 1, chloroplastic [Sesamum calycinum]|uniref:FAD synthase n=1 Tax=Sesamum calycinum TaxID=2727403 RepID=A0AAW2IXV1_9LAMI
MMISGHRISQQLREYNPCQLGICSFNGNKHCWLYYDKAPARPPPPRRFPFCFSCTPSSKRFSRFQLLGTSASCSSSSSPVANDNDDITGVSFVNNENCRQDTSAAPVLSGSLSPVENGWHPPSEGLSSVAGGVVALGKFDALHIGHRELVIQAAKIGVPFLYLLLEWQRYLGGNLEKLNNVKALYPEPRFPFLDLELRASFLEDCCPSHSRISLAQSKLQTALMAYSRAPIVPKCDRKRILSSWAPFCGNVIPKEFHVEFSKVRHLTPKQFVEKLSKELGVRGVVAGQNYRFGYKAAGDVSDLMRLCKEYGMKACIINSVMDKNQESLTTASSNSKEQGQVSSTRVRYALANGDMKYVSELLGRHHRLILMVKDKEGKFCRDRKRLSASRSCLLNLPPKEGLYRNCSLVIGDENVVPCRVIIDMMDIHLEWDEIDPHINLTAQNFELLGIDFGDSDV